MTPKEQAFKIMEGRIDTIQKLSTELIEFIYNAAYNAAIEAAAKEVDGGLNAEAIRKLKK